MIKTFSVNSIDEYIGKIRELRKDNATLWFRGHSDSDYKLMPSLYRTPYAKSDERQFMGKFKSKAIRFVHESMSDDRDASFFQWLFVMQHYGTPTRLLDWSQNALTALAFATQYRNDKSIGKSADVWCLNPIKLNEQIRYAEYDTDPIPNICEVTTLQRMYCTGARKPKNPMPVAIAGIHSTDRIIAQNGTFCLFPDTDPFAMEDLPDANNYLYRIILNSACIEEMSQDLYYIGISETTLFPELESISKEIRREYHRGLKP